MTKPLFSIITACYNSVDTIQRSIDSIKRQTLADYEHIIIDGGSIDGTMEIIKKNQYSKLVWISEKDRGYADAWNKGLDISRGRIIGILNSDDIYKEDTFSIVSEVLKPEALALSYGITRFFNNDLNGYDYEMNSIFNHDIIYYGFGFMHTTCFVTKKVYDRVGNFSLNYKIASDSEFLLRCIKNGVDFINALNITYMQRGGMSDVNEVEGYMEFLFQLKQYNYNLFKIINAANKRLSLKRIPLARRIQNIMKLIFNN